MPEEKARVGFSIDLKDSQSQINNLIKSLEKAKTEFSNTGRSAQSSLNNVSLGLKSVFNGISKMAENLRKNISDSQSMSRKQLKETLTQAQSLEARLIQIHDKTAQRYEQAEGKKRQALKSTLKAQEEALKQVKKVGETTQKSINDQQKAFQVLESIITVKVASAMRNLVKEATLLAARNEVLGTAMRTVANNAGFTNAEINRNEVAIRKLGISINDSRELISRFTQAQLGLENATKLARAAQDLAAGSTLGSSEALQIMTQSILALLPRQLRQFGVVVNLTEVYREQAKVLGKSVNELTSLEKRQGLLNKIFEEAAKRAGAYERSMEDSGKVLTTLSSRIVPDTMSVLGEKFLPILNTLVFGFKDLLEWVQDLGDGWKTLIAAFAAGLTAVLTLKAGLITLSATLGFVKSGFVGAASAAAASSAALGPLIIAVGALAAALVVIPKLLEEQETAQAKLLETSKANLDVEVNRLKSLKDLRGVLENQALTEDDLRKILENNLNRYKELIPLVNKETLSREDFIKILDKEIEKREENIKVSVEQTKKANEAQIEALKDEQYNVGLLITRLAGLNKEYKDNELTVGSLLSEFKKFKSEMEDSGESIDNLRKYVKSFADNDLKKLQHAYSTLGDEIRNASKEGETDFGLATKGIIKSAEDTEKAIASLNDRLDKLASKTEKKYPFKRLIAEQDEFIKALEKSGLEGAKYDEILLRSKEVFQDKFIQAELKFREKLDSIGQSNLQKIEARTRKELEINQGSSVAVQAIELQAAYDRNNIFKKMWDDRLQVTLSSIDSITRVLKTQRDLRMSYLKQESTELLANDKLTADQREEIRQEFYDNSINTLRSYQEEELSVRQQYTNAAVLNIKELYEKGIITEEQYASRAKDIATDLKNFRQTQLDERIAYLRNILQEMVSAEANAQQKLIQIDEKRAQAAKSTDDTIRQIRQKGLTDYEVYVEERKRADALLAEAEIALQEGNFKRIEEINKEVKDIAVSTSNEIRENGEKDAEVLISADQARISSIELVKQAGELLQRSFEEQRSNEEEALVKVKNRIDDVKVALDELTSEKREIEVKIVGEAEKQIDAIRDKLATLKDKTITVTVVTKNVTADSSSAAAGGPIEDIEGEGGEGFANGAVDIQGPGTSVSDSIVAFLSKGESVMNAAATRMFKPILEMMNNNPMGLLKALPSLSSSTPTNNTNISESMKIGDININLNGVDSNDIKNVNWRRVVREQVIPEIKRVNSRKSNI